MSYRPHWDNQFRESPWERADRQRKARQKAIDPRDPDPSRPGIFRDHNCYRCKDGTEACVAGNPRQCEYPRARND